MFEGTFPAKKTSKAPENGWLGVTEISFRGPGLKYSPACLCLGAKKAVSFWGFSKPLLIFKASPEELRARWESKAGTLTETTSECQEFKMGMLRKESNHNESHVKINQVVKNMYGSYNI